MNNLLTEEDILFLQDLANELRTQDTACTAKPVYYSIMQEDKEYGIDQEYADGMCVIGDEGETFTEANELIDWLIENYSGAEEQQDELRIIDDLEEIYDYCNDNKIVDSLTYTGYRDIEKHDEMFLTRRALKKHIEQNYYHYKENPVSYAHHAWRNPELEKLLKIVDKFSTLGK